MDACCHRYVPTDQFCSEFEQITPLICLPEWWLSPPFPGPTQLGDKETAFIRPVRLIVAARITSDFTESSP